MSVRKYLAVGGHLRLMASPVLLLVVLLAAPASPAAGVGPDWRYWRKGLEPLKDAKTWVLEGEKLAGGGCSYAYSWADGPIPESGYAIRSIALDPDRCLKLMEEGVPTAFEGTEPDDDVSVSSETGGRLPRSGAAALAAVQTRWAWQRVYWADVVNLYTTATITEISWDYDGTDVLSGTVDGTFQWRSGTGWVKVASSTTPYKPSWAYFRGQTAATYSNNSFCFPLPKVWNYYYYNRVWGHPDGHATRAQSSDSVDECVPLHVGVESAYGHWPG